MQRVHTMPFGASVVEGGVCFNLWAPSARNVQVVVDGNDFALESKPHGWRHAIVPQARVGSRYGFRIDGEQIVPDPASRFQPADAAGLSCVMDPNAFAWGDGAWRGRPWEDAVFYELHVGTFTPEGTFASAADRLESLKDLGVTAIELMPIGDFCGRRNWGYDGVLPYAPDSAYGVPDDLKRLVERAHSLGMMVFLDVVYNHFGPSGNFLNTYAKSFFTDRHQTPWGDGINFDGGRDAVARGFFIHNALYWVLEFHLDGLRFDAVHAILDDSESHILADVSAEVRGHVGDRHVHLVLENDDNIADWLRAKDGRAPAYNAQWNDDLHHCWHTLLTGETSGYYQDYAERPVARLARCLSEGFAYQGEPSGNRKGKPRGQLSADLPPSAFVAFLQNHDQIGNRAFGDRIASMTKPRKLDVAMALVLLSPQIPMLFMGEEWAASTPFLFFVDFASEPGLSEAIRDGRRREFATFEAFSDPKMAATIPDPTERETFERSRLDWSERTSGIHARVLSLTRTLLALRQDAIVPLTKTPYRHASSRVIGEHALQVAWSYAGGDLGILANFGDVAVRLEMPPAAHIVWRSDDLRTDGPHVDLPSWTALVWKQLS